MTRSRPVPAGNAGDVCSLQLSDDLKELQSLPTMECGSDVAVPPAELQAPLKCPAEDAIQLIPTHSSEEFLQFKRKASTIVEEYFSTDDVAATANELRELRVPCYHYYFVKKLVSVAMDRHDREKEMAAVLLSSLYGDVIDRPQLYKGFCKLTESCDDLSVDTPDAVDILAVFVARAILDDMLPPAFLAKQRACLPDGCKGAEVLHRAEKSYLSVPHHGEIVLQRWGGSKRITVEEAKAKISDILQEYLAAGDKHEACRCIRDLKIPFFHHDVVKRALVLAVERGGTAEGHILDLLKSASQEGVINESQVIKGFNRLIDSVEDLALDVPNARCLLQSLILKASSEGWLCASCLKPLPPEPTKASKVDDAAVRQFKANSMSIVREYFLSGDIIEVVSSLEAENYSCSSSFNAIFVKKLINAAMDRKSREKEMASVLLSSLCLPPEDVVAGFHLLIESAEDAALDNPAIVEDLTMFFARSVVDEVIAPSDLELMEEEASCEKAEGSTGLLALQNARALLGAKLSAERILRCWGGGGSGKAGWELHEVKDKISRLLQEYNCGGDIREACRCIKDLGMPFFHHEVVKKALVTIIEKRGKDDERLWALLSECYGRGLITPNQMTKGFERVADCIDDLALDVPDAGRQLGCCVEHAKKSGWLDASFTIARPGQPISNGVCS